VRQRTARAFTLTELLIVIGIIVLFITLALPAFNLLSGTRSIAGAENLLGAMLGRARADALGASDYRGLAIYRDTVTDRYYGAIVQPAVYQGYPTNPSGAATVTTPFYPHYSYVTFAVSGTTHNWVAIADVPSDSWNGTTPPASAPPNASYWSQCDSISGAITLDAVTQTDVQAFPAGVGVQVITNCPVNSGGNRTSNGYLPLGVVLFDGTGTLAPLKTVSFAVSGLLGTTGTFKGYFPQPGGQTTIPYYLAGTTPQGLPLQSSLGFVAFDKQTFDNNGFYSSLTPQFPTQLTSMSTNGNNTSYSTGAGDGLADAWLDANATPLLVNRYNGTVIRSE
jgi:type II secretory pathway pseudopilin PulG